MGLNTDVINIMCPFSRPSCFGVIISELEKTVILLCFDTVVWVSRRASGLQTVLPWQ